MLMRCVGIEGHSEAVTWDDRRVAVRGNVYRYLAAVWV